MRTMPRGRLCGYDWPEPDEYTPFVKRKGSVHIYGPAADSLTSYRVEVTSVADPLLALPPVTVRVRVVANHPACHVATALTADAVAAAAPGLPVVPIQGMCLTLDGGDVAKFIAALNSETWLMELRLQGAIVPDDIGDLDTAYHWAAAQLMEMERIGRFERPGRFTAELRGKRWDAMSRAERQATVAQGAAPKGPVIVPPPLPKTQRGATGTPQSTATKSTPAPGSFFGALANKGGN